MPYKDPEKRKAYLARYYEKNKDTLSETRAAKYQNDARFRDAQRNRATRRYWEQERPKRVQRVRETRPPVPWPMPVAALTVLITAADDARCGETVEVLVYSSSAVGKLLRRSPATIREWEAAGVIPPPTYRNADLAQGVLRGRNARLYTHDELLILAEAEALLALPKASGSPSPFSHAVHALFQERLVQGVYRRPR